MREILKSEQHVEFVISRDEYLVILLIKLLCRPDLYVMCRAEKTAEVVTKGASEIATLSLSSSVKVCNGSPCHTIYTKTLT